MKTIIPNIWMLLLRISLLAFFIYMFQWPLEKIVNGEYQKNIIAFSVGILFFVIIIGYLILTLCGVLWVTIYKDFSIIRFHHFYKTVKASFTDIDCYYKSVNRTKLKTFKGLIIKLNSKKVVEVTEYNLKSINEINLFLNYNKIALKGDKSSWFPLQSRI